MGLHTPMLHDFKGLVGKIVTEGFSHPLPPSDASALYCSMVVNRKMIILINLSPHKPIRLSLSLSLLFSLLIKVIILFVGIIYIILVSCM